MTFPDNEAAVIGAMILDRNRIDEVLPIVTASDFADQRLREIFIILADLAATETPINATTIVSSLKAAGSFDRIGGAATIAYTTSAIGSPADVVFYASSVRQDSIVRQLRQTLAEATQRTLERNQTPADLIDFIDARLLNLRDIGTEAAPIRHVADAARNLVDDIDAAAITKTHRGLRTGLECFDKINGGYQNGTLNIIAARPSNGKSVLALQFAEGIGRGFEYSVCDGDSYFRADQPATPTLLVSLEMTEEELAARSLASATEIDGRKINSYRVTAGERQRLRTAAEAMRESKLQLWEPHRATVSAIRAKARLHARQYGLGCLVIDYLQLIDSEPGTRHEKETYRIGEICRHLKQLAKELTIPVVVCCQLNRDAENKKPTLAQLADSGKIEQHADTITAIHRLRSDTTEATLKLLKWRNGQTPEIEIEFDRQHCRFQEQPISQHANYEPAFAAHNDGGF